jgi:hypothetical protein
LAFGFAGDGLSGPPVAEHADRVASGAEVLVEFGAWDDAVGGGAKREEREGEEWEAGRWLWHGAAGEDLLGGRIDHKRLNMQGGGMEVTRNDVINAAERAGECGSRLGNGGGAFRRGALQRSGF